MNMKDGSHYNAILAQQLVMNRKTWALLQQHGVTEQSQVRLDFSFEAPTREAAEVPAATFKNRPITTFELSPSVPFCGDGGDLKEPLRRRTFLRESSTSG